MNPTAEKALNVTGQAILFLIITTMLAATIVQHGLSIVARWALDYLQGTESDIKYWSRHSPLEIFGWTMDDYIERMFPTALAPDDDLNAGNDEDATDTVATANHEIGSKSSSDEGHQRTEPLVNSEELDALLGDGSEK